MEGDRRAQVVQIFGGIFSTISSISNTEMIIQIVRRRRRMTTIVLVKIRSQ
jgi:hypothetical protein